jgi:histidyl-tRNA synthetase
MAESSGKTRRPRAETPRGFRDWVGAEVLARNAMLATITEVYRRYGFDPLETSAVETVEALGKFLPDVDRPNEGVFAFQDDDETWLALRYDLTAPLARFYAQNQIHLPTPYRRYAVGPVWRNEKPGPGRFRQFYQCDADTVGAANVAADAEICAMLADALEAVGIARGDYLVRVNNRKVLNGVLEAVFGSFEPQNEVQADFAASFDRATRDAILRTIDKFDKVGREGVRELLMEGRLDASGARIEGLGLSGDQARVVLAFLTARGETNAETIGNLTKAVASSKVGVEGVRELEEIASLLAIQGYEQDRVVIDPSVVRGLGYYTGPVYEAELTFEILDEKGRPRQFGSVAGGGRYDDLVMRFTGQKTPATGVSIGVDRLLAALREKGRLAGETVGPVVVCVMDRERMAAAQTICAELRRAGLRAEAFLGGGNMGKQLKYADRRASPVAVIEGSDEAARGVVTLKDLALGARLAAEIETNEDWKAQPAQIEVPRGEVVAAVKAMIARGTQSVRPSGEADELLGD